MSLADFTGLMLAWLARLITGTQGHWKGCPPTTDQRIYFANHQSHFDWVLIWAALPRELRAVTRPIAARDYWTATPLKQWITREIFNAVYVSRERKDDEDPPEPLWKRCATATRSSSSPRARAATPASPRRSSPAS